MAKQAVAEAPKSAVKYYRSNLNGLSVIVGNRDASDPSLIDTVRFQTVLEKWQGDTVKVGYLATDNKVAIDVLANDANVQEISKADYDKAVGNNEA